MNLVKLFANKRCQNWVESKMWP